METIDSAIASSSSSSSSSSGVDLTKQRRSSHEDLRLDPSMTSPTPTGGLTSPVNNSTTTIPTRFVDRRVSAGGVQSDPYKFNVNYSEAGQRLAKKAQAQLKSLEKSKEDEIVIVTSSVRRVSVSEEANGGEAAMNGDDWQNVSFSVFFYDFLKKYFLKIISHVRKIFSNFYPFFKVFLMFIF